ncbi:MAG: FkbM family methyltransferase [Bacteroidia bacterium]
MLLQIKEWLIFWRLNLTSYFRKVKMSKEMDKQKVKHLESQVNCEKRWYGSSYGGFYIHPRLLNENAIVYSFGIGKDITFDKACMNKHKCKVFAFDPTEKSIRWIKSQNINPLFHFYEFGIAPESGTATFYLPANPKGTSGSLIKSEVVSENRAVQVQMRSFEDITKMLGHTHIDVLKMDIEGSEYEVLAYILNSKVTIHQFLIEFHDRLFEEGEYKSVEVVRKMNEKGYVVFAQSMNYEEISFIKEDLLK